MKNIFQQEQARRKAKAGEALQHLIEAMYILDGIAGPWRKHGKSIELAIKELNKEIFTPTKK
jgi:hypothetical protein|tara:strand:- start:796 stop:981 length:186 start_codon:yes stop_codon:yes gene_type:complete